MCVKRLTFVTAISKNGGGEGGQSFFTWQSMSLKEKKKRLLLVAITFPGRVIFLSPRVTAV